MREDGRQAFRYFPEAETDEDKGVCDENRVRGQQPEVPHTWAWRQLQDTSLVDVCSHPFQRNPLAEPCNLFQIKQRTFDRAGVCGLTYGYPSGAAKRCDREVHVAARRMSNPHGEGAKPFHQ